MTPQDPPLRERSFRISSPEILQELHKLAESIASKSEIELKLHAILNEFSVLKAEIQTRSGYHQRLLELQVTALTLIAGAALAYPFAGKWLILLIPLESAIFGLWWIEHALVISEIGAYIERSIESRISALLTEQEILCWEEAMTYGVYQQPDSKLMNFRSLLFLTFAAPSIASLLIGSTFLLRSVSWFEQAVNLQSRFGLPDVYVGSMWYLALLIWSVGVLLLASYMIHARHRGQLTKLRKQFTRRTMKLEMPNA
jgi:hypothetical protein